MIPTNHHHPQSRYDMEMVMYTQRIGIIIRIVLHWGGFCHVSKIFPVRVGYPRVSRNISKHYMNQSKLATWHVWCGKNIGNSFGVEQIPDIFGAEQISDIFWCGPNFGPFLVRTQCRTISGAEQIPDIIYLYIHTMTYDDEALIAKTLIWRF